jgi:HK97 family phage prohead protease
MKHATFQVKATTVSTDKGTFTAVISTESIDREGDVVIASAMVAALREWLKVGKKVPLAWAHSVAAKDIIGHIDPVSAMAVNGEVVASGWIDQSTAVGAEAWRLVKSGTLGFSFGYLILQDRNRPDGIREISKLDVSEVSACTTPMQNDTRVLDYKTAVKHATAPGPRRRSPRTSTIPDAELRRRAKDAGIDVPTGAVEVRKQSDAAVHAHVTLPSRALRRRSDEERLAAATGDRTLPPTPKARRKAKESDELRGVRLTEYQIMRDALTAGLNVVGHKDAFIGNPASFTDLQWQASCVLDYADCDPAWRDKPVKERFALPIKRPGASRPELEGLQHAARQIVQRGGVCNDARRAAAKRIVAGFEQIGEVPVHRMLLALAGKALAAEPA